MCCKTARAQSQIWERLAAKAREAPRRAAAYRQIICKGLSSWVTITRVSPKEDAEPTESAALLLKLDGCDVATANSMHQLGKYSSR